MYQLLNDIPLDAQVTLRLADGTILKGSKVPSPSMDVFAYQCQGVVEYLETDHIKGVTWVVGLDFSRFGGTPKGPGLPAFEDRRNRPEPPPLPGEPA